MRILCGFIKCIVGIIASAVIIIFLTEFFSGNKNFGGSEIVLFIIAVVILLSLIGSISTGSQCPNCKSTDLKLEKTVELDRWLGRVKVREKMASGKIRERYVQRTMVKRRYHYCCQNCKHTYTETREVEL